MTQGLTDGDEIVVTIEEIRTLSGNTPTATGSMYAWNQKGGVTASSTGNMTGVYDLQEENGKEQHHMRQITIKTY